MEKLDRILEKYTDPAAGLVHGAAFIAIDRTGMNVAFSCASEELETNLHLSQGKYFMKKQKEC